MYLIQPKWHICCKFWTAAIFEKYARQMKIPEYRSYMERLYELAEVVKGFNLILML